MKNAAWFSLLQQAVALAAVGAVLGVVFLAGPPWPAAARDYLEAHGVADSGALNLVSAIYLGYRAFDTLGETIVLLTAASGAIAVLALAGALRGQHGLGPESGAADAALFSLPDEKRKSHLLRTNLVEEVTGKVAPVVLLFGFYLMLYGHRSPGGGFQGGVVVASGIVFLALGSSVRASPRLVRAAVLARLEAAAFLLLAAAAASGMVVGRGFFDDPVRGLLPIEAGFIVMLNTIIGLKVGAGIGLLCVTLLGRAAE